MLLTQFMPASSPANPPVTELPTVPADRPADVPDRKPEASKGTLRAAVIGTGKISEEHLKFLHSHKGAELVGVCDLSPSLAQYAARSFTEKAAYTNSAQMLDVDRTTIVHMQTPAHTHSLLVTWSS